jgi:uncharacterized membrane protein
MQMSQFHYLPLTPGFFSILVGVFFILFILLIVGALRRAYLNLGVSSNTAMLLLLASLIGSYFNIPIAELPHEPVVSNQAIEFFGMQYTVPVVEHWPGTVIAVNVGGAVIPTLMSLYLLITRQMWVKGLIATAIVAVVLHWLADPVPGVGIAVPVFWPALITAVVAWILARENAAPLAYVGGSLGTLIGADLTNLDKVRFDRRCWYLRRHFSHRHPRRPVGGPLPPSPPDRAGAVSFDRGLARASAPGPGQRCATAGLRAGRTGTPASKAPAHDKNSEDDEGENVGDQCRLLLEIPLAAKRVARCGKAVEEAADNGGRRHPGRRQARQAQRARRQVGKAQLAHDAECRAILDLENALGRELRLRHLPHAGNEQPDADRPEHEPLADENIGRAAEPQHLPDDAARRQDEEQQNDRCQIHTRSCGQT